MERQWRKLLDINPLIVIIVGVLFGSSASILVRYSTAPSLVLAAYRKVFVTLIMLPFVLMKFRHEIRNIGRTNILWCCLSGFFLAIHFYTYYESIKNTTIAASQVLTGMEIVFVAAFMFLFRKESYNKTMSFGIIIAILGSIIVAWNSSAQTAEDAIYGNLCAITCAMFSAFYSLIGTKVRQSCSNTVYTFFVYGSAGVVLTLIVPMCGYSYFGYGVVNYVVAIALAIFCSLLSHSLFNWALRYKSPTLITIFKQVQPVLATFWGVILFSEMPLWNQIIGGVILISGICIYTKAKDPMKEEFLKENSV